MSLKISYIGHATVLGESRGTSFLTDPLFSDRIFWIKRKAPLNIDFLKLPDPGVILISHAHYDHLDLPSFKYISSSVPIVVPPGIGGFLRKFLKNRIHELPHGNSLKISDSLTVTSFPVKHWGFRLLPFRYTACNGYLISIHENRLFFPGDTAYHPDFNGICRKFRETSLASNQMGGVGGRAVSPPDFSESSGFASDSRIDVALLPIGAYRPESVMKNRHLNPEEALRVFQEIGARWLVPIHWGTFKLSTEPLEEPPTLLARLAQEAGVENRIRILRPGQSCQFAPRLALAQSAHLKNV